MIVSKLCPNDTYPTNLTFFRNTIPNHSGAISFFRAMKKLPGKPAASFADTTRAGSTGEGGDAHDDAERAGGHARGVRPAARGAGDDGGAGGRPARPEGAVDQLRRAGIPLPPRGAHSMDRGERRAGRHGRAAGQDEDKGPVPAGAVHGRAEDRRCDRRVARSADPVRHGPGAVRRRVGRSAAPKAVDPSIQGRSGDRGRHRRPGERVGGGEEP